MSAEARKAVTRIRAAALRALCRREHATTQLSARLERAGHDKSLVKQQVEKLQQEGLVDDARYAQLRLRSRSAQGYGKLRIRQELLAQGVAADIVEQVLATDDTDWRDLLNQVRRKKFGAALPQTAQELARQTRFLLYRGFSSELISRVLSRRRDDD